MAVFSKRDKCLEDKILTVSMTALKVKVDYEQLTTTDANELHCATKNSLDSRAGFERVFKFCRPKFLRHLYIFEERLFLKECEVLPVSFTFLFIDKKKIITLMDNYLTHTNPAAATHGIINITTRWLRNIFLKLVYCAENPAF